MYHSLIINADDRYINTWDDWFLIPSSRPVISPPMERTNFVTVPGRNSDLDYSQSLSKKPVFDDRTGKIEFYLENDITGWDWETAYTTIIDALQGKRVRMALEDNPSHYYEGLLWVNQYKSDKGHSKITLEYKLHPIMKTLNVGAVVMNAEKIKMARGTEFQILVGVGPTNTFYRKVSVVSDNKNVAVITRDGLIRALRKGKAVITAECGGVKAECAVDVGDYRSFPVTRTLNGCTESNPVNRIVEGGSYQNLISVTDPEKTTLELSVTVEGNDVTKDCVTMDKDKLRAEIKMENLGGAVEVTANAAAKPETAALNETLPTASIALKRVEGSFRI